LYNFRLRLKQTSPIVVVMIKIRSHMFIKIQTCFELILSSLFSGQQKVIWQCQYLRKGGQSKAYRVVVQDGFPTAMPMTNINTGVQYKCAYRKLHLRNKIRSEIT